MAKRAKDEIVGTKKKTRNYIKAESETTLLDNGLNPEEEQNVNGFDCKYIPKNLKFREWECKQIQEFIEKEQEKKFLMVTGLPGSGKTLFVSHLLSNQDKLVIQLNAMSYKNYHEFLCEILGKLQQVFKKSDSKQFLKNKLTTVLCQIKKEMQQDSVLMIDEFDNLFFTGDKSPFDLFQLTQNPSLTLKIIGLSNDIEFLQMQYKKYNIEMPQIKNVIFCPYTREQMIEIIKLRIQECGWEKLMDFQTIKFFAYKCYNDKGSDIRNILDCCKRVVTSKKSQSQEVTIEDINDELNQHITKNATQNIVEQVSLEQQIILLAFYIILKQQDKSQIEIDYNELKQRITQIKYQMNLQNNNNLLNEHLNELKDYKLLEIKNVNQKIGGFKSVQKKVIPKIDQEIIKHSFSNIAAFEMFFKK